MLMRNGLTYSQASDNCNRKARVAYNEAIKSGKTLEQAQDAARSAYEAEMNWYES